MATIFSKIAAGEIPSYKVAENDNFFAFLDIHPLAKGHTLVIPRKETDYIFDIEPELYTKYWSFTKQVAQAIEKTIPCLRVGVAVVGLDVPHAHIHLVPLNSMNDMNFAKPKLSLPDNEMKTLAEAIGKNMG